MVKGFTVFLSIIMLVAACSSNGIISSNGTTAITCYSGGNIFFSDTIKTSSISSINSSGITYKREDGLRVHLIGDCVITSDENNESIIN